MYVCLHGRFDLDLDETHKIEPYFGGTYKSNTGVKLRLNSAA